MPMIPDDDLEGMKRSIDLAAVIRARGIELKPQGGDLVGLCPFHEDKTPSLHVTPAKRLWRCTSCHATGNVIQFVQRFDGVSFRHAYELLKNGQAFTAPTCSPVKKTTVPKLPAPVAADADDQAALRQVLDYYHERLKENPPALAYLKKRGITAEAVAAFRIGFVDRTLGLRLPHNNRKEGAALRARLQKLGILRDTGHEHLRGRVVFPVVAETGEIGTVYGRAIDDGGKHERHLFLPGPLRGVFNPAALRAPEVILTEGIIDALTFWGAGFRNVTTSFSAKPLSEELLAALVAAKTRRVLIAFDRDEAGDRGAAEVASQLSEYGIEAARVLFPHGQDVNSYALAVTPPEKSLGVLLRAAVPLGEVAPKTTKAKVSPEVSADAAASPSLDAPSAPAPSSLAAKAASEAATPARGETTSPTVPPTRPEEAARKEIPSPVAAPSGEPTATPASPAASASPVVVTKHDADEIALALGDRAWTVRGLAKNAGFESLKVTLRLACGERWHLDNLDLCVARQRAAFIDAAAAETALRPELVKRDLGHVLRKLEELQEARLKAEAAPKKAAEPELSAQARAAALDLLRAPDLLKRILADLTTCGLVGEETNKLVGYLAAVSRLLPRPLAIIVRATSAAGKSSLMDAILALMPPESRVKYSALTGQALYYLGGETSLRHKILAIVEEEGAEKASYALKLLQSEGELAIASTGKDPHTGRMVTQEYRVEGPVMIILTTTAVDLDEELLNRCIVLTVDESREQTAAIHAAQRRAETLAGLVEDERRAAVLALHRDAQRLLRPLKVVNPYGERLTFLDDRTRTRRDHKKYLTLIRAIALLHQHQRPVRTMVEGGKPVDYVEVTLDDIAAANALAHEVLGRCLDDMPPQTRRLLGAVQALQRERAKATAGGDGGLWRRRDLRAFTGWGDSALKLHLARLVELEYVIARRDPEHLNGLLYELVFDGDVTADKPHLSGLLDVEKLRAAGHGPAPSDAGASGGAASLPPRPHGYDEKRSGQNGGWSGVGQPSVTGQSGVGQPGESAASTSENPVSENPARRKTHAGDDADAAA
jgi:DNA primase